MLNVPIYQVDAFANQVFEGNPAAVCPLENWLPDATMLVVQQDGDWLVMDFPAYEMQPVEAPADVLAAFDLPPTHVFRTHEDPNYHLIYEQAEQVRAVQPNLAQLEQTLLANQALTLNPAP